MTMSPCNSSCRRSAPMGGLSCKKAAEVGKGWEKECDADLWWIYLAARRIVGLSERYFRRAFSRHAQHPGGRCRINTRGIPRKREGAGCLSLFMRFDR